MNVVSEGNESRNLAYQLLIIVVALQALGAAGRVFIRQHVMAIVDAVAAIGGKSAENLTGLNNGLGSLFLACGIFLLARLFTSRQPVAKFSPTFFASLLVGLLSLIDSFAAVYCGRGYIPQLEPLEHAVRFTGPFVLAFSLTLQRTTAVRLLQLATAATFFGHGIVAIRLNPHFLELISFPAASLLRLNLDSQILTPVVSVIGWIDVLLVTILLIRINRFVLGYMIFWGLVTAFSRILYFGPVGGLSEFLVRIGNGGIPLVLLLLWSSLQSCDTSKSGTVQMD